MPRAAMVINAKGIIIRIHLFFVSLVISSAVGMINVFILLEDVLIS
jgi:hypothetical protein